MSGAKQPWSCCFNFCKKIVILTDPYKYAFFMSDTRQHSSDDTVLALVRTGSAHDASRQEALELLPAPSDPRDYSAPCMDKKQDASYDSRL